MWKSLLCKLTTAHWNGFSSSKILRDSLLAGWKSWVPTNFKYKTQTRSSTQECGCISRIPCRQCGFQSDWDKDEIIPQSEIRTISENKEKAIHRDDPSFSLREKQNEDTDVSLMKNWVKESTRPDFSKFKGRGYVLQSLWSQWNRLTIQNDLFYRKCEEVDGKTIRLQAIVPIS